MKDKEINEMLDEIVMSEFKVRLAAHVKRAREREEQAKANLQNFWR